jgi:hypothetical protein
MERYRVDQGQAFAFIVQASQVRNVKLRELARDLVGHAEKDYVAAGMPHLTADLGDTSTGRTCR